MIKGTVVQAGTTSGGFTAVVASTDHPIGVLAADCAAGGEGWIVISGVAEVLLKNSTGSSFGDWIGVADTDGRAWSSTENGTNSELEIGHCIETKSSGTNVLAKVILHFN